MIKYLLAVVIALGAVESASAEGWLTSDLGIERSKDRCAARGRRVVRAYVRRFGGEGPSGGGPAVTAYNVARTSADLLIYCPTVSVGGRSVVNAFLIVSGTSNRRRAQIRDEIRRIWRQR